MAMTVQHIADVSFKNHFLDSAGNGPVNGQITVNHNTFDVTFADGKVSARFASGNWFTNLFRSNSMSRFTQTLQAQYDSWVQEKSLASAAADGFKNNPNVDAIKNAVDQCLDVLYEKRDQLDSQNPNYSKEVAKAFAMRHTNFELNEEDADRLVRMQENMPPNMARHLDRLGQIAELAAVRNELTTVTTGTEAADILKNRLGFLTHMDDNCEGKSEADKKRYILNMVDTVIDGFLQAVNAMTDKNTQVIEFLNAFDGACIEAKSDNVQAWAMRSLDVGKAERSNETNDLAYSATAEFNVLAEEVQAPFREEIRKSCEPEVREKCAQEGITDPEAIQRRVNTKVEQILTSDAKQKEIAPLIRQKLETDGKFALYDNLAGAKRPVTRISKNEKSGTWTVETVVDKNGKPVLKPVSAYDIDKNFSKLVDMFMDDAILMGMVENKTVEMPNIKVGNRMDLHAEGVVKLAEEIQKDDEAMVNFSKAVKSLLQPGIEIPDDELLAAVKTSISNVVDTKRLDSDESAAIFSRFVSNYADGSYADQITNVGRLANLVARRVESLKAYKQSFTAGLDAKASRCAQMLKMAYPDKVVDVKKAQEAIATALRIMIDRVQNGNPQDNSVIACRKNLNRIMSNGRLFSDALPYDVSHRAAGKFEIDLHSNFNGLLKCIEHYAKIERSTFIRDAGQEVQT